MKLLFPLALVALLVACAPPSTPTLFTPEVPTPTAAVAPLDLSSTMEVGSRFLYEDGTTLVAVPSGPFVMGHGTADNPEHGVTLSAFWIYATKVTNHQYLLCEAQGRCSPPDPLDNPVYSDFEAQNQPVVGVTYAEAAAYCRYVNGALPTEAQWEKAARGPTANRYPWGNADPSCSLLNFDNCQKHTTEVNQYTVGGSFYGALDMAGNVYEWTADWFDPLYYKNSPPRDPPGPDLGRARVIRASGYRSNATQSLSYARAFSSPGDHRRDLGFR
ncbi:MAG TPA: SUMF1/EgtB/PvdO family nonheme iron enzyme, partial [Geobacteraceae bacterium]|nr:SUMF1/EgtB/PvdO family nonheme iron enzyme [Geobacteraceae bacterium]